MPHLLEPLSRLLARMPDCLRQRVVQRRILIVVAGLFICLYSVAVLAYALTRPFLGFQCPFSNEVQHAFPGFARDGDTSGPHEGDYVLRIGEQRVETWQQVMRAMTALASANPERIPAQGPGRPAWDDVRLEETRASVVPLAADGPLTALTLAAAAERELPRVVRLGDATWARVEYVRALDEGEETSWRRVGRPPVDSVLPSVLWFLLKGALFAVGAFVFWKRPEDRWTPQFFLLCLATIGAYMGGYHWLQIVTQPALLLVFMASSVLMPAVTLHFYLLFPRPRNLYLRGRRPILGLIYGLPLVFLATIVVLYFLVRRLYDPGHVAPATTILFPALRTVVFTYFAIAALFYVACVVCLLASYRGAADVTERNQVKWILLGALAALVPIGYSLYLALLNQNAFGRGAATWPMFLASVLFTGAFAVSITRYRLMQLDQLISSGVSYFLVSFLAGLLYYALVFVGMLVVGSRVNPGPSLGQALWVSSTALVLMLVLDLVRSRFKRALDRHFRKEKHLLDRTLKRMGQAIDQLVDPPALARRLLETSTELLGCGSGAIYLRQGDPPVYSLVHSLGSLPPLHDLPPGCPLVEAAQARGTIALSGTQRGGADHPARRQLVFLGGAAAQALMHEDEMRALLVLGPREDGPFTADDLHLLAAFARVTVLGLVGAEGRHTIEALNRELREKVDKIAEQQRRILALERERGAALPRLPLTSAEPAPAAEPVALSHGMVGDSPPIRHLLHLVRKVAASQSEVLIRGESGTGKELLARALHETSPRAGKPFVKVHCAALAPGLLESELFGHVKGAFTGAHRDKVGRFQLAHGGTLFLDEIGDIDLNVQTKLLRVLQEMTFERVGDSEPIQVEVRVIAATHQDLEALIAAGRFREDLYYRLNVISLTIPPLRERREDIPELAQHFLRVYGPRSGKLDVQIDDDALVRLRAYDWPGNIRQLENVIERAVVLAEGPVVLESDLPPEVREALPEGSEPNGDGAATPPVYSRRGVLAERADRDRREREQLVRALAVAKGNKAEAARALGLARSTFISRLKKHGLS